MSRQLVNSSLDRGVKGKGRVYCTVCTNIYSYAAKIVLFVNMYSLLLNYNTGPSTTIYTTV